MPDYKNILLVVDANKDLLTAAEPAIVGAGATVLPYEAAKAMA